MNYNKKILMSIIMTVIVFSTIVIALPEKNQDVEKMLPCFADGKILSPEGLPVKTGINVTITNLNTGAQIITSTGKNFPPAPEFANQFKSVFGCEPGVHKVNVSVRDGEYHAEEIKTISKEGVALFDLTLKKDNKIFLKIESIFTKIKNWII